MAEVESVTLGSAPTTFSKGSGQYAAIKQHISDADFEKEELKVNCSSVEELKKTQIAIRTYLSKQGITGVTCRKDNLTLWIKKA